MKRPDLLERVSSLTGLDVADVMVVPWPKWGRVWSLTLTDGRIIVLGHDRHVRDWRYLSATLRAVGSTRKVTAYLPRTLLHTLAELRRVDAEAQT